LAGFKKQLKISKPTVNFMNRKKIFAHPWGYAESFVMIIVLILIAFVIEFYTNFGLFRLPVWPYNFLTGMFYIALLILVHIFYSYTPLVNWLSGIPACISSIVFFAIVSLTIALVPKTENHNQPMLIQTLFNLQRSWFFIVSVIYLLTCLGLVILRRFFPVTKNNLGFLANHLGLWIIIFAGSTGSGDQKVYQVNLELGKKNQIGCNLDEECIEFPFSLKLTDFTIDYFPAKVALVEYGTDKIDTKIKNNLFMLETGIDRKIKNFKIKVEQYLPAAIYDSLKGFVASNDTGTAPAALLLVTNFSDESTINGWISRGSNQVPTAVMGLNKKYFLMMTSPDPKLYRSTVEVTDKKGSVKTAQIEVNKSYSIHGWKLYQTSYDINMGKYSRISILDAVKDPWLPFVYLGIFLLMAGSIYLFWIGKNIREE
jgi:hypothetical protein